LLSFIFIFFFFHAFALFFLLHLMSLFVLFYFSPRPFSIIMGTVVRSWSEDAPILRQESNAEFQQLFSWGALPYSKQTLPT
jgi:hypothetical protein